MGLTKDYLLQIQENCSDQLFGQEAVEWAIYSGWVKLTGNLQTDLRAIMGEPGQPETGKYDDIIVAYQRVSNEHGGALAAIYEATGILDEILRPQPTGYQPIPFERAVARARREEVLVAA